MIALSNIKSLEYELPANVMIVHLKKSMDINGFQRKEVRYKCDYKEFLKKGGEVKKGATKPMKPELGISKNVWNQTLTKDEKAARDKK